MNELLNKLSSYNIFNYLLPGAVFSVVADRISLLSSPDEIITRLIWYYFVGMVISRLGSIVVEPALKWARFVRYSDYNSFLIACDQDRKLDVMVEVSNTYRTLATAFLVLIVGIAYQSLAEESGVSDVWRERIAIILLLALFLSSFRKQVNFIRKRVDRATKGGK
ncbi:hypothetical protein [Primorskyibacter marinus]|uniref:hypothetical protein n=1 Tax=Primorskyibacter marinus TaxID=1977320 RepID=UPI000E2FFF39|nr:hypothetical protein [Primorskyibacter marinus]